MIKSSIYLNFNGQTEAAFEHYHSIFGGEAPQYFRFEDMPDVPRELKDEDKRLVCHTQIRVSEHLTLMGSDCFEDFSAPLVVGNNVTIHVSHPEAAEVRRIFDALAAGGRVDMPLETTFWSPLFGCLTDRFGINWMLSLEAPQAQCPA
ncbi:MAG: VOC family protein [Bacteroidaceae bacterium]|nr:VOC family protein [Bacteroidaceae bacterium]